MKFSEIAESASAGATGAGSVASVSVPLSTQTRKGGNLLSGKKTKKWFISAIHRTFKSLNGLSKNISVTFF